MNLLFPVSVTVSTVITVLVAKAALADGVSVAERAGYTFLTVLMALAILEHWMLVLPMPAGAIWSPGLKSRGERKPFEVEIVVGFLGAGKTTFLQRKLKEADPALRTVVLVNDFGALGLDGALLEGRGADVVELSNGCICCSLRSDLAAQLKEVVAKMKPDRVLIEPSGVADVASLLRALHTPEIAPLIRARRLYTVIDAGAFLADYIKMPDYFDVQTRLAPVFVLNKTDLVSEAELSMVTETLRSQNPAALIVPARYGIPVEATDLDRSAPVAAPAAEGDDAIDRPKPRETVALGLESWSAPLMGDLDLDRLREALAEMTSGAFGQVMRVKGIATTGKGWVRFDVAGGRSSIMAHVPQGDEAPRALAIGLGLDREGLAEAFLACTPGADRDLARAATEAALDRVFGASDASARLRLRRTCAGHDLRRRAGHRGGVSVPARLARPLHSASRSSPSPRSASGGLRRAPGYSCSRLREEGDGDRAKPGLEGATGFYDKALSPGGRGPAADQSCASRSMVRGPWAARTRSARGPASGPVEKPDASLHPVAAGGRQKGQPHDVGDEAGQDQQHGADRVERAVDEGILPRDPPPGDIAQAGEGRAAEPLQPRGAEQRRSETDQHGRSGADPVHHGDEGHDLGDDAEQQQGSEILETQHGLCISRRAGCALSPLLRARQAWILRRAHPH